MPGNPYGNRNRCRACNQLASKDGWCKRHRPERKGPSPFRDNFKATPEYFNKSSEFGAIKDKFGEESKWG